MPRKPRINRYRPQTMCPLALFGRTSLAAFALGAGGIALGVFLAATTIFAGALGAAIRLGWSCGFSHQVGADKSHCSHKTYDQ